MRRTLRAALLLGSALLTTGTVLASDPRFGPGSTGQSAPPTQAAAVTGTAAISGVVTDAATGRPIAGAAVNLFGIVPGSRERPATRPAVLTDPRGRFVFVNLSPAPRYTLVAGRSGYAVGNYESPDTLSESWMITVDDRLAIKLEDGDWKRDANIRMWRLGSISGRVLDEHGEPVVGAAVRTFSRRMIAGHERLVPSALVATDDRGVYRVPSVRPGQYVVAVLSVQATVPASTFDGARALPLGGLVGRGGSSPPVSRTEANGASIDVDGRHRLVLSNFATPPPPGADRTRAYAPVFHPNARTPGDAIAVEIAAGTSRADVDFQLSPVAASRVSGRVTGPVEGAVNMMLRLMPSGAEHLGFGCEVATALVEPDGTFTFLNVPGGDYTLMASSSVAEVASGGATEGRLPRGVGYGQALGLSTMYDGIGLSAMWWKSSAGATVWGRVPVSVGDSDVTGLVVPLRTASTVRGRIAFADPAQDPSRRINITLEPVNGDPSLGVPNAWTAAGDDTYAFTIGGLQGGRYVARYPRFFGWRVVSVTARGVDITETGFDGSLGQDFDDVVVTVTNATPTLSGVVRDSSGAPAAGAVIVFSPNSAHWIDYGLTPDRLGSARASADGTYSIATLRDGDYLAIAVPPAQAGAWVDPKFLAAAAPRATRVALSSGAPKTLDLRLTEVVVR